MKTFEEFINESFKNKITDFKQGDKVEITSDFPIENFKGLKGDVVFIELKKGLKNIGNSHILGVDFHKELIDNTYYIQTNNLDGYLNTNTGFFFFDPGKIKKYFGSGLMDIAYLKKIN